MRMTMERQDRRNLPVEEEKMDLSGLSLKTLPNPAVNVTLIRHLDLANNNLESIPESLTARLLNVVFLDVHSNELKTLPNSIGCLSKLKVLNVSGNLLESLPKTIENCRALVELNANFNKLTKLPETIGFELLDLQKLSVNSNKLAFLPFSISHMTNLRALDARLNCLRSLPEDMENLLNLETLNVSQNFQYLTTVPYSIGFLVSLVELDVSYNNIKVLPDSIGCLKNLQKLHVAGNPLVSPPMDIAEKRLDIVKEYLSERMNRSHESRTKKTSWFGNLVKSKTFNGRVFNGHRDKDGFLLSDYRSNGGLTSPRFMTMLSPRRLFSPKSYSSK
ncbi:plant intracellular Ras-group-related LRR protein 1-like [Aristolochia californica]|uniref:plant intracellular Ras-group-related LRR protein 1-like n=1 Tax=Aristolochia californica TaxID=171875 RepID=UPI0035DAC4BB